MSTDYGLVIPALVALGAYRGGVYVVSESTKAWAKYLNEKYDFSTVNPEAAVEQIDLARRGIGVQKIVGNVPSRAMKAAYDLAQAYVKSAYLMGVAARYLGNQGLAEAAYYGFLSPLGQSNFRNTTNKAAIETVYRRASQAILSAASANNKYDQQVAYLLAILGGRTEKQQQQTTALPESIGTQQQARLDPEVEAQRIREELSPDSLLEKAGEAKERLLRRSKRKEKREKKKARNITIGVAVGVGLIVSLVAVTVLRK